MRDFASEIGFNIGADAGPQPFAHDIAPPDLRDLKLKFDNSRSLTEDARKMSIKCQDYYDGEGQLSASRRAALLKRGQQPIYIPKIQMAVDGLSGIIGKSQNDPEARPRSPRDADAADVVTKTLRWVADTSKWAIVRSNCVDDFLIKSTCAALTIVEEKAGKKRIRVKRIPFNRLLKKATARR